MPAFGRESVLDIVKDKLKPNTYESARNFVFNNWKEYERVGFLNGNQISTYYSPWGPDHFVALPFLDAPPTTSLCKSCSETLQKHWDPSTGPRDDWTDLMPRGARDNLQEDDPQEFTNPSKKDKYPARETNPWAQGVENFNALHSSARYCGICRASYYAVLRGYHPRNEERVGILFDQDISMRTGKVLHLNIDMKLTIYSSSDLQEARQRHISCKGFFELYADGDQGTITLNLPSDPRKTSEEKWECLKHWRSLEHRTWKSVILGWWQPQSKFVPTRLLYITHINSGKHMETYVRVVHSAESTIPITRYIALSHRWGAQTEACKTTKGDIHKKMAKFSVTDLPPKFRDAVEVTTRLGYQYLWIDSLCIIQDDPEDWEKESAQMQDVYTQADLVIAVHFASDNSDGFLAKSMSPRRPIGSFPWGTGRVYIDDEAPGPLDLMSSPIAFRGWILQERQLARRTIHFFERGIWLETSYGILTENGFEVEKSMIYRWFKYLGADRGPFFDARPDIHVAPGSFGLMETLCFVNRFDESPFATTYSDAFGESEPIRFLIYWLNMIEQYSKFQLTKPEDKLIAISGLARMIHNKTRLTYLAGTWVPLVSSLLWLSESRSLTPSTANRAPSWSWAAYDGPIQFVRPFLLEAHDFNCISVNGDPIPEFPETGLPERGLFYQGPLSLQIQALVISLSAIRIVQEPYDWPEHNNKPEICSFYTRVTFELHVFTSDVENENIKGWICFDVQPDNAARHSPLLACDGFWEAANPDFCFVKLANLFTKESHRFQGIFVVGVEMEGKKVYRRIGMGEIDCEPPKGFRWIDKDKVESIEDVTDSGVQGEEGSAARPSICEVRTITLI